MSAAGKPSFVPYRALAASPLAGVSFVEFFGIGNRLQASLERLPALASELRALPAGMMRPGLSPHAPYSVDRTLYLAAARLGLPLTTHLAETTAEREFVARASGPQRTFLERLGIWDDSILNQAGKGVHPAEHLADVLGELQLHDLAGS